MKKLLFTFSAAALAVSMNAQTQNQSNIEAKEHVETTMEQTETISEVYGIMVCRLTEDASSNYQTGAAEISYADLKERVEASTEEHTFTNGDETVTFITGPSVSALDDNHGSEPPALLENESALDYLNRLEQMISDANGHEDFLIIATTGGEFGIAYTRVQASDSSTGIADVDADAINIGLFPNPTTDQITITGLPAGNHMGQILDATGKTVMEITVSANEQLNISNLAAGMYTLKVLVDGNFQIEKFQIKK